MGCASLLAVRGGATVAAMELAPVVFTQIRVPARPRPFVARPRLAERVGAAPITLVCGPAGAGKTTVSADWAERAALPVAWVSLEREDDEPFRFWRAVLASLRVAGVVAEGSALAALEPPAAGSQDRFAPELVNALAELRSPAALVLDDAHLLRSRKLRDQLGFLLMHLPPPLRVVLAARSDPGLPLHVLRVRTSLAEVRMHDLAFTRVETAELLAAHALELSAPSVTALHARTEGWAAGLRMAALSLQRSDDRDRFVAEFAGDDRVVSDYLVAELLESMPARDRRFLLRTSVAGRLCGGLAEAITGEPGGAETLERLAQIYGFVIEDGEGWFSYHTLFAGLLRARLHDDERACHRRAAAWHAAHGMSCEALRHAIAGHDTELAAELVAAHWVELFSGGERRRLRAALDELPPGRVSADPELSAAAACARFDAGEPASAREHLAAARGAAPASYALARSCAARHDGDLAAALDAGSAGAFAHLAIGVAALWSYDFARAEEQLRRARTAAGGGSYLVLDALAHLALTRVLSDGPEAAAAVAAEAAELARRPEWARTPAAAAAHAALAYAALFESRPGDAAAHRRDASDAGPEPRLRLALGGLGALIRLADGHLGSWLHESDAALAACPQDAALIGSLRARLLIARGDLERAQAVLDDLPADFAEVAVARARLALAAGAPASAAEPPALLGSTRVEAHVTEALVLDALGLRADATARMERALALAETGGHRSAFPRDAAAGALLQACIRAGTAHRALAGELLQTIDDDAPAPDEPEPLGEPLTDREREVLAYLPTSAENRDIAAELGVTTNTVKTHLRGIYRKLEAENRRDAVARARTHRLLCR